MYEKMLFAMKMDFITVYSDELFNLTLLTWLRCFTTSRESPSSVLIIISITL